MANELTLSALLHFKKGGREVKFGKNSIQLDVTGTDFAFHSQNVGTSEEALDIGDVATPGYLLVYNNDSANFVTIRAASGEADVVKVRAGGVALFELAAAAPFVIADTATVEILFALIEA